MKSAYLRWAIMLVIALTVLFGSSIQSSKKNEFSIAHSGLDVFVPLEMAQACQSASQNTILVPKELYPQDFEKELFKFILNREYATDLNWCADKRVRDIGPWIKGTYYAVHPAVRIYYSPRMMYWLTGDPSYWKEGAEAGLAPKKEPREGEVPSGAMIVKEMFTAPADIYQQIEEIAAQSTNCDDEQVSNLIAKLITSWTIMIKTDEKTGPKDGWYWSGPSAPKKGQSIQNAIESQLTTFQTPIYNGFGLTCIRCHASAENSDFTFSSLRNVEGFYEGENMLDFFIDNSWRDSAYLNKHLPVDLMSENCLNDTLVQALMMLPPLLRPWVENDSILKQIHNHHMLRIDSSAAFISNSQLKKANPLFRKMFPEIGNMPLSSVKKFPNQWADHVVPKAEKPQHFITSDNCLGCHGGLGGLPSGVDMFVQTGPDYGEGYNISEYGEWRWSPMGLAGRDPIFYSQLESEMALLERDYKEGGLLVGSLKDNMEQVTNTCLSCHGAMGQRQLTLDARKNNVLDSIFRVEYVYLAQQLSKDSRVPSYQQYHEYGELAREGISCAVCHHIDPPSEEQVNNWKPQKGWVTTKEQKELAYFLFHNNTGRFELGPEDKLNGPFKEVATLPMQNALGMEPVYNEYITNSQMCGTCHTINLPNIGMEIAEYPVLNAAQQNPALKNYNHSIEQATFIEWQNSAFARGATFQSCQDCHMPNDFHSPKGDFYIDQVSTRIATIQGEGLPEVEHIAPFNEIHVPLREDYKRHELVGLNIFLLEMFDQFPEILGVAEKDAMTYDTSGNELAIANMARQAREETVDVSVEVVRLNRNRLTAKVTVRNKTGHRYPSGVGFRRGFLEFLVMDGDEVVWGSGRTNSVGVIVDQNGQPLRTEFLPNSKTYQPHHQKITKQNQVQIYEELNQDKDFNFTTSFIHRVHDIKDNRLLPDGWFPSDYFKPQGEVMYQFMEATDPKNINSDPDYRNNDNDPAFKGQDQIIYEIDLPKTVNLKNLTVRATMYNQSIPPFWLHQRFTLAPNQPATKRLYYITSRLNLKGTPIEDWKLKLDWAEAKVQ
jgi:hypothetical protein